MYLLYTFLKKIYKSGVFIKLNLDISTNENVYQPSDDTYLLLDMLNDYLEKTQKNNLSILDMGTGTGILGIYAASNAKVKAVTLVDINPDAVSLAKSNIAKNLSVIKAQITAIQSNLYSNLNSEIFDIILFNPPYLPDEEKEVIMNEAFFGGWNGIEVTKKFLDSSKDRLTTSGRIFIISSSLADISSLKAFIEKIDFSIQRESKVHIFFEDIVAMELALKDK
ncbi:MAG: HemK2/MTQ2 family protein methyltransferase [Candidatus Micrarchaeia archaeon]